MTENDAPKTPWPELIMSGADDSAITWQRQQDRASVTSQNRTAPDTDAITVLGIIDDEHIVISADPKEIQKLVDAGEAIPAYGIGDGPAAFIPTGRIFVRLEKELELQNFAARLQDHGFTIVQPHSHFAFAGWIAANSESVADALSHCGDLRDVEGVVIVEPEMLGAKSSR